MARGDGTASRNVERCRQQQEECERMHLELLAIEAECESALQQSRDHACNSGSIVSTRGKRPPTVTPGAMVHRRAERRWTCRACRAMSVPSRWWSLRWIRISKADIRSLTASSSETADGTLAFERIAG